MSLRHALLGLLAQEPASGYDLMKMFDLSLANVWPATQSQVYAELTRMSKSGLLKVAAEGPRGRKEYAITDPGRAELRRWLLEDEPVRSERNEMLLRVFFLGEIPSAEGRGYLRRQAELAGALHDQLKELREVVDQEEGDLADYGRLALEWGLRFAAMQREWAEWAEGQIRQDPTPEPPAS